MKQKSFLRIVAISMIVVLTLIGLNIQAYAVNLGEVTGEPTGTITVKDIEKGVTAKVTAYKIATVNYDTSTKTPKDPMYTWNSSIKTWIESQDDFKTYADPEKFAEVKDSDELKKFYSSLAAEIRKTSSSITFASGEEEETTTTTGSVTFTDYKMGLYLILVEGGARVYTPVAAKLEPVSTTNGWTLDNAIEASAKSTEVSITKKIGGDKDVDNYATDKAINFVIEADKPVYEANSRRTTYKISDKLSDGLVLAADENKTIVESIKVFKKVKGDTEETPLTKDTDYTIAVDADNKGFTIDFVYANLADFDQVAVKYNAKLAADNTTVLGTAGNNNTATLTYTNNPYTTSDTDTDDNTKTKTDTAKVFTYGIDVTKIAKNKNEDGSDIILTGAQFQVKKGEAVLKFVKDASDNIYYLAEDDAAGAVDTVEVNANGKLILKGLDEGSYSLKETKAPDGYNIPASEFPIVLTDGDAETAPDGQLDDEKADNTGVFKTKIENSNGFQLPVTGGMGTVIFATCGIVFVGLGIVLLVVAFKKRK